MNKGLLFLIALSILAYSCMSSVDTLKPYGETVTIKFKDHKKSFTAELIHANDTSFVYLADDKFVAAGYDSLYSIYVNDYKVTSRGVVLLLSLLVDCLTSTAVLRDKNSSLFTKIGILAHTALTFWGIIRDKPRTNFSPPFSEIDIYFLKAYSRYPIWYPEKLLNSVKFD